MARQKLNKKTSRKSDRTNKSSANPSRGIKNSSTVKLVVILVLVFIIGVVITSAIYINLKVLDYFVLNASVKIVDYKVAGINTNNSGLIFGKTYPGGGGTRYFNIISSEQAMVYIRNTGKLSEYISYSNNSFIIQPGENITIAAELYVPETMIPGNYTGQVHIYLLKP